MSSAQEPLGARIATWGPLRGRCIVLDPELEALGIGACLLAQQSPAVVSRFLTFRDRQNRTLG